MEDEDRIRRKWMARLGTPVELDFSFFAIEDVFARGEGRTVALGELGTGSVLVGDALEAVGVAPAPVPVAVARVERPAADGGVETVAAALAGDAYALTLEHAAGVDLAPGQCLAPPGRLASATAVEARVWTLGAADLPGSVGELRRMLAALAAGDDLELFFHARPVAARATSGWAPRLGAEDRATFELAHAVALYPETRFAVRHRGLLVGVGVVDAG